MTEQGLSESGDQSAITRLVDQLSNDDIRWDGTFTGLVPTIVGDEAQQLLAIGDDALPQLISVLEDESKFVVAHVLLTLLSGVEYRTTPWNGLTVDLAATGEINIDARQRFALARRWRAWQQTTPRPRSLHLE